MSRALYSSCVTRPQTLTGPKVWSQWNRLKSGRASLGDFEGRIAKNEVEVDFSKFTPDKYLLSWITAICGVEVEEDGHSIVTPHNKLINDNGNSWTNEVLLESYRSFILAEVFLEHVQVPELSKGKLLDAVAWVIKRQNSGYPEPIPTIFVDVLMATNKKKHAPLVKNILSGVINSCSMGCDILWSVCSRCGKEIEEGKSEPCSHIRTQLGRYYTDSEGKRRRVSEQCGVPGKKGSCVFKECSWVLKPAFMWAKLKGFVPISEHSTGHPLRAFVPRARMKEAARED